MKSLVTHRKCMVCGEVSADLTKDKCDCGAYMYMISPYYAPKIVANPSAQKSITANKR